MTRKEKKRKKEIERINRILKTIPKHIEHYTLEKKCPRCRTKNNKENNFCVVCNFDISKIKIRIVYNEKV